MPKPNKNVFAQEFIDAFIREFTEEFFTEFDGTFPEEFVTKYLQLKLSPNGLADNDDEYDRIYSVIDWFLERGGASA